MSRLRALLLLLVAAPALAAPPPAPPPPPQTIDTIRDEATALVLVQSVLSWYTRTLGEPSIQAETYRGHAELFSPASIRLVAAAQRRLPASAGDGDAARALAFLKSYLASEFVNQSLSAFDDEAQNAELKATVRLSWQPQPIAYKQLDLLSGNEPDAARRGEIEAQRAAVWKTTLNPILERKEAMAQRLSRQLGYRSYVALAEEFRRVDLRRWIVEGERFHQATDGLYRQLLTEVAEQELHVKPEALHRADVGRLRKAARFAKFFPRELMIPAFRHFVAGLGLDLKTVAGTEVRIDDALHEQKEPRAACYSIRVPSDIRITVKPTGGIDDFVTFFHEGGHALHYANTTTKVWEFQQLGPYALTESLAESFGHVWDDPVWLARYRDFVAGWNRTNKTSFPVMSDGDIRSVVRQRVWEEIYFLRRYAAAKLIYEAALHGGDPSLWKGAWSGPTTDLQALYRDLFARAYGFPLGEADALRYRTDVDDLFYAADYTRAFGLANVIHEGLRKQFGADWYKEPRAGALWKSLAEGGNRPQPDEVAKRLGCDVFDLRPSEARWARLLGEGAK